MICKKCEADKEPSEFYAKDKTCKECRKARVRENYRKNKSYYQDYERSRAQQPHRIKARREYARTQAGKDALRRARLSYIERYPARRHAHVKVGNAIKRGELIKQPCEVCGDTNVHAHHDDYSKPLDVRWLCVNHHLEWHEIHGEAANG